MTFDKVFQYAPYELEREEKERLLTDRLLGLTAYHKQHCAPYSRMLNVTAFNEKKIKTYRELPFLPVRLFKEMNLKSVLDDDIVKTLTSSGTSGQATSKIYLNKETAANQQKAMVKIVSDFTGEKRMPMLIIDCPSVIKNRSLFSARGAGILGFSVFGTKRIYALDDEMRLRTSEIQKFLEENRERRILLFGFTFMIWQYFYKELLQLKKQGIIFDLSNAVLIHGGGWKKLEREAVSKDEFRKCLCEACGITKVHDYYGMVEQTGSLYMQCECGHLHASIFSDVMIRNPVDFSECKYGERGIIQTFSTIPESYPGHSLLTEDEGILLGEDDCPCGRKGKYFKVLGRLSKAEIRGCSDTFAVKGEHKDLTYLIGSEETISRMRDLPVKKPFDDEVCRFLEAVSRELLNEGRIRNYSDVAAYAFWLRKASTEILKKRFQEKGTHYSVGRGVAFHIAPSNVPINFAYSLTAGLLMGNANIVRVPSKDFLQTELLCMAIQKGLRKYPAVAPYISLVCYGHEKAINDRFSAMCDVRIIWGGDRTITDIRSSQLPPRATEVTFSDRYSLAVINSDAYLRADDKKRVAKRFYNDTYYSDQNACTSPRVVIWTGEKNSEAKDIFWNDVYEIVRGQYDYQDIFGVNKLCFLYEAASVGLAVEQIDTPDNLVTRIHVRNLEDGLVDYFGNTGYFYEYDCKKLPEIYPLCKNGRCQTIGFYGNADDLLELLDAGFKGVDRIVPLGNMMDFDLLWDGYDLTEHLTRKITVMR